MDFWYLNTEGRTSPADVGSIRGAYGHIFIDMESCRISIKNLISVFLVRWYL